MASATLLPIIEDGGRILNLEPMSGLQLPNLALEVKIIAQHLPVQLDEAPSHLHGGGPVRGLENEEASNDLLRLCEGTVRHLDLAGGQADARTLGGRPET